MRAEGQHNQDGDMKTIEKCENYKILSAPISGANLIRIAKFTVVINVDSKTYSSNE